MAYLNVMTRIEDREDDELLHDLGGRDHPSFFFLDALGEILARHDAAEASVKAFEETGARVKRSLELREKAEAGDPAARIDFALAQCELGVLEISDLESAIDGKTLAPEQEKALAVLRVDATVSDMGEMLRASRDAAAKKMVAEEFTALYAKGTHPARAGNRRFYWTVLAGQAIAVKDAAMLKAAIEGLRGVPEPPERQLKELEEALKNLGEPKGHEAVK